MKTPMQEHIEWMEEKLRILVDYRQFSAGAEIDECIQHAAAMFDKEKEVIMNAWIKSNDSDCLQEHEKRLFAELYYDATFNTKEK
jgi:hypothetical protein